MIRINLFDRVLSMQHSKFWFTAIVLCALLSGCSGGGTALSSPSDYASSNLENSQAIAPQVSVKFTTKTRPSWAQEAEAMMAELEQWRGKRFTQDLVIHIKAREPGEPAGWYSPTTKQLVVTDDGSNQFKRGVMLHEIFHALQDQTFNLTRLHQATQNSDADQAIDALIEGEAMLAVSDLMQYNFAAHAKLPVEGDISEGLFNRLFEYGSGMEFVQQLREAGGWEKVDQVFQKPPQSTQAIYHPDKYLSQADNSVSQGIGEYGFRLWLARDPETRSQLASLQSAYQSDELTVDKDGTHTWTIDLDSETNAKVVQDLAPKAIAKMPQVPQKYQISQSLNQVTIEWSE